MPALKRKPLRKEQQRNLSRHTAPDDFTPPDAYPEVFGEDENQIAAWVAQIEEIKRATPGAESILQ